MSCETSSIAPMTSSGGIRLSMSARAISAAAIAFIAPAAFRLTHGTSTSPATGSQVSPSIFLRAMAQACAPSSGDPPCR